ncbi:SDR family oxidoreductase [Streptomyces sp. LN549]|uniref:type I polyketide synthase n=1 Tax=Streptomyces sp. LN549 TaxID=3112979 RepID=UPI003716F968
MDNDRESGLDIAVIGLSCAYPGADGPAEFWHNIVSGVESLTDLTDADLAAAGEHSELIRGPEYVRRAACIEGVDLFDAEFFGLTPRQAEQMDPQHRLFLEHCWRAVESAGYDPRGVPGPVGVYAGQGANTYIRNVRSQVDWETSVRAGERWESVGSLENDVDYLTPKVSYHLGLSGPSIPLGTACSTSLVAIHLACQALRTFECDAALAGGVAITPPVKRGYLYVEGGIASADGRTRSFDSRSTGTVFGSGVGVVMLKRLEDALADGDVVEGVIVGSAINNDGAARAGFTAPSVDGQAEVIMQAQAVAGVHPDTVTYLEAHGTGTPVGDPIEVAALTRAFREQTERSGYCTLGSVKANIGHMDSAAGVAGVIKALLAAKHGVIPPQLNYNEPNKALRLDDSPFRITTERETWRTADGVPRRAGISSFGIGGTNAHVVIEQPPAVERDQETGGWHLIPVSARNDQALGDVIGDIAETLEAGAARLDDAAYTLQTGRTRFARRAAVVARNRTEAAQALRDRAAGPFGQALPGAATAFLFPGQGAHYPGMARGLYDGLPEFAESFDRCAELFAPLIGLDLRDLVMNGETPADETPAGEVQDGRTAGLLGRTRFIQPALFSVEYALARTMIARGAKPTALLGHSLGELVAAAVAGVFTLEDAVRVIDARARFMDEAPDGGMLAVPMPAAELEPLLPAGITVAAYNGPRLVTVAGERVVLDQLRQTLDARGVTCRPLRVPHAAHSAAMSEAAARFTAFVATVPVRAPRIPFLSNVTGTWITEAEACSPAYWGRQMREPVRFEQGLSALLTRIDGPLVEAGPGHGLLSLTRGAVDPAAQGRLVRTMRSSSETEDDDLQVVQAAFAALWELGVELSWSAFGTDGRRRTGLPTYAFQRKRYWIDLAADRPSAVPAPVKRVRDPERWFYSPAWRSTAAPRRRPAAAGAANGVVVVGADCALTATLAARAADAGRQVTRVLPDSGTDLVTELSDTLSGVEHAAVVFAAGVDGRAAGSAQTSAELLALSRALATCDETRISLLVLTSGAFDVSGDEPITPDHALLAGIGKVIPKELRHVSCRVVDLDPAQGAALPADQLLRELDGESDDLVIAYRGTRRWTQDVEQLRLAAPLPQDIPLHDKGVYLITGGLGGIGLSLARFLAREYGARLVLSGRTAPPERAEWDGWLARYGADDPVSRQIGALRAVEAAGGEVVAVSCDVTDAEAVRSLLVATVERFGRLDGVVHSAGLTGGGGLIETLAPEEFHRTVAPKVAGAEALLAATSGISLDFLALFSSLTTVDSWDGAADYTAGNAYLDALAHRARRQGRSEVLTIDWTGWMETGMNAGDQTPDSDTDQYLTEDEGHSAFVAALAAGLPQIHVSVDDLHRVLEQARRFARDGAEALPGTQATASAPSPDDRTAPAERHDRPSGLGDFAAPETTTEIFIGEAFQRVLGFDRIGRDDSFFALGGNSLLALDLVGQIRRHCGARILLRDFFSGPTVRGLAALVEAGAPQAGAPQADEPQELAAVSGGARR